MNYKLSPSDLTFLLEGCKHCFVLKVRHGIPQPSIPLPGIFSTIAALQKEYYSDKPTRDVHPALPAGVIRHGEKWVQSVELKFPGLSSTCHIKGRFDIVAELEDKSYAVMDFKTGSPRDEKSEMYGRQLHAYMIALEKPAPGELGLGPVSTLGLLYFTPESCGRTGPSNQTLEGPMQWVEIPRNDMAFLDFLGGVLKLLDGPLPPPQPSTCDWCGYRVRTAKLPSNGAAAPAAASASTPKCPECDSPMRLKNGRFGEFWSCSTFPSCRGTRKIK